MLAINALCFQHMASNEPPLLCMKNAEQKKQKKRKKVVDFIKMPLEEDLKGHCLLLLPTLLW